MSRFQHKLNILRILALDANINKVNLSAMLYNQKQRQLIIWDQRGDIDALNSMLLFIDFASKLTRRHIARKFKQFISLHERPVSHYAIQKETVVQNINVRSY